MSDNQPALASDIFTVIITIAGYKGGIGKTTTAIHLAAVLSKLASTVLVDADENRSAMSWAREGKLPYEVATEATAQKLFMNLRPEHAVIDTKARPSPTDLEEISAGCDLMILPTTTRPMDLEALIKTVQKIKAIDTPFKVLLNMVPPTSTRKYEEVVDILKTSKIPVFDSFIQKYSFIEQLPLDGILAYESKDENAQKVWKQYRNIGKEILK